MINGPILIVDDDPPLHDALATALTLYGYEAHVAENGREALAAIEAARPALVLLDFRMPIMDGEGFLREAAARQLRLPVILMSADDQGEEVARRYSVEAYLRKPISLERLLAALASCSAPAIPPGEQRGAA